MAKKISAGFAMYRFSHGVPEVLLGHPGGPLYTDKDAGYWGIPKGEVEPEETLLQAALREFSEETGLCPSPTNLTSLGTTTDPDDKMIYIWAFAGDCDTSQPVNSNLFTMEWPCCSGRWEKFPEIDCIRFFPFSQAQDMIEPVQKVFLERLEIALYRQKSVLRRIRAAVTPDLRTALYPFSSP